MTLYLDTSALVKLYVAEAGSPTVRAWVQGAGLMVTVVASYAEARATFARLRRAGELSLADLRRITGELDSAWRGFALVDLDEPLAFRAGRLAEEHALRGYDAVQLAAAVAARPDGGEYLFASFDARLNAAATREGLRLSPRPADLVREGPAAPYRPRARSRVAASGRSR